MNILKDHAACSGCSLCLLVCPMWRRSRDISQCAHGYAKAMQNGATANDIADEIWGCSLCGACDPVCPEQIDLTGMILKLRRDIKLPETSTLHTALLNYAPRQSVSLLQADTIILPGPSLRKNPVILARIGSMSGSQNKHAIPDDDGTDISLALESGAEINPERLQGFIDSLRGANKIIVADGLLLKHLKHWLPATNLISVGEALSNHVAVRHNLRTTDLYVIEPRAYHADYQRLVKHYDRLRVESGSAFNLDLQRIAIPVNSRSLQQKLGLVAPDDEEQARWVLHGHRVNRIVVECLEDRETLEKVSKIPVVHLSELLPG